MVGMVLSATTAYGWGPNTHGRMALKVLNYPTIAPYLAQYGLNRDAIAGMAKELDYPAWSDTYHHPAWQTVRDRLWLTDPKWSAIGEERKIAFLLHLACDAGVPMSHSPANEVWTHTIIETMLEARVDTWGTMPDITPYSGTYSEKMTAFYNDEIAHAQWCKKYLTVLNVRFETGKKAGWGGLIRGQNLAEAMMLEYFQTRGGVPEPATLALLAAGGLGVVIRRRR